MKQLKQLLKFSVFAFLLISPALYSGAFNIYEQGSHAMGLASAFTARANDPSAIFHNPAGIAFLHGWQFYTGGTFIAPSSKFTGVAPFPGFGVEEETKDQVFFPPNAYLTFQANHRVSVGLGFFAPFGLVTEWKNPDTFSGRFLSQKAELKSFYLSSEIAVRLTDNFALAGGVQFVYSTVELKNALNQPFNGTVLDVARTTLDGDNNIAIGFDVSAIFKPSDFLQLGALYRSKVSNDYTGTARFEQVLTGNASLDAIVAQGLPANASGAHEIGVATKVNFPWLFAGGILVNATKKLSVEFDLTRFGWSEFGQLPFDFAAKKKEGDINTPEDAVIIEDYNDANQYRFGLQYQLTDHFALRGGYIFDDTPVPTKTLNVLLPDGDRNDFTLGFGYTSGPYSVDVAWLGVFGKERSSGGKNIDNFNGTYDLGAQLLGINIGYRLK